MNLTDEQKQELRVKVGALCGKRLPERWEGQCLKAWADALELPNYPDDLNACHEMEKLIPQSEMYKYWDELHDICGASHAMCHWSATATQRAQAFVKVMEDSK